MRTTGLFSPEQEIRNLTPNRDKRRHKHKAPRREASTNAFPSEGATLGLWASTYKRSTTFVLMNWPHLTNPWFNTKGNAFNTKGSDCI